jgi:hypothetical protein
MGSRSSKALHGARAGADLPVVAARRRSSSASFHCQSLSNASLVGNNTLGELGIVARKVLADYETTTSRFSNFEQSRSPVACGYRRVLFVTSTARHLSILDA